MFLSFSKRFHIPTAIIKQCQKGFLSGWLVEFSFLSYLYRFYNYEFQSPYQVNYELYTDIIFFVTIPELNFTISYEKMSRETGERLALEFVAQAKKHHVKPLLSFGGWTGSRHFSKLTSTNLQRKKFAHALVKYTQRLGFEGIDLDWEYPNSAGIGCNSNNPSDTTNFGLLLKEIRYFWPKVQLTAALNIEGLLGANGKPATLRETSNIVRYLDFVNLMAYDVFGPWAPTTGPIGPLSADCAPANLAFSVKTGVHALLKQGFKASQIVVGNPGYAKRFKLVSSKLDAKVINGTSTRYYQNHTKVTPPGGRVDDRPGKDICGNKEGWGGSWTVNELIKQGWLSRDQKKGGKGYKRYFDRCSGAPFLTDGNFFIAYDDIASTVEKARFTKQKGLAGLFFFDTQGPPDATVKAARAALRS
ncbi:hypothetical protein O181_027670 [Austropuccinia psidii MF-1]|uniref:GH18 domain-containing protein n=1 Tax=Austropuccinia psidii MF-1 TaxID=1389203 RepID=A0A9Q3CRT9_9BASI|nr:hypothetical protein [Austropuccinia psidii MF-1]